MKKKNEISAFWIRITFLAFFVLALQFLSSYLIENSLPTLQHIFGHVFIYALTGLGFMIYAWLRNKFASYAGYIFGALSMGKMLLASIFLLPAILHANDGRVFFVLQFMTIYMVYLFVEVFALLKNIKNTPE